MNTHSGDVRLPIGEVARRLGVSLDTVRRWEREGRISATRTPGGQRRFSEAEVLSLAAGTAKAAS